MATRLNIDNYIHTTERAIREFTGCNNCKVILNLNPAEPCVDMQTTMFLKFKNIRF
jgi:acetaldehyde dehydrogenase (acetylating)